MQREGRLKKVQRGRNHRRVRTQKMYVFIVGVFVLGAFVTWITNHPSITIDTVLVEGLQKTAPAEIRSIANKHLDTSYLYFIPKRNIFFFPEVDIKEEIREKYKIIKNVEIKRIGFKTLHILLEERVPHAKWCGDSFEYKANKCIWLDKQGYFFSNDETYWSDSSFLEYYGVPEVFEASTTLDVFSSSTTIATSTVASSTILDNKKTITERNVYLGEIFIAPDKFNKIDIFVGLLSAGGVDSFAVFFERGNGSIYLNKGGILYFNLDKNLGPVARDILVSYKDKFTDNTRKPEQLEYIDTRFNNKILFKFVE